MSKSKNAFSKSQPALKKVDFQTSTKLQALIKKLKAIEIQDPRYKGLVFSQVRTANLISFVSNGLWAYLQFTSMLTLIEPVLTDNGISWL